MEKPQGNGLELLQSNEVVLKEVTARCDHCETHPEPYMEKAVFTGDIRIRVRKDSEKADPTWGTRLDEQCRGHHKKNAYKPYNHSRWLVSKDGQDIGYFTVASDAMSGEITITEEQKIDFLTPKPNPEQS